MTTFQQFGAVSGRKCNKLHVNNVKWSLLAKCGDTQQESKAQNTVTNSYLPYTAIAQY